ITALSSADRVPDSDSEGRGFKSLRAGQAGPGAECAPGSFLIFAGDARGYSRYLFQSMFTGIARSRMRSGPFSEHGHIPATMPGIFSVPWVQEQAQPYSAGACGLLPQAIQSRRHCACLRFKKACGRRKTTKLTIYCEYTILEVM